MSNFITLKCSKCGNTVGMAESFVKVVCVTCVYGR
ncbi:hypothetical protein VPHD239_0093 [Vibrio phage D239]